jgi:hypothetical protein
MRKVSKLIVATTGVLTAIGGASVAPASPIGAPGANQVPVRKGTSVGGLFDNLVGGHDKADAKTSDGGRAHKHLTAAEWRQAYIARHGHDLPSLSHPGH